MHCERERSRPTCGAAGRCAGVPSRSRHPRRRRAHGGQGVLEAGGRGPHMRCRPTWRLVRRHPSSGRRSRDPGPGKPPSGARTDSSRGITSLLVWFQTASAATRTGEPRSRRQLDPRFLNMVVAKVQGILRAGSAVFHRPAGGRAGAQPPGEVTGPEGATLCGRDRLVHREVAGDEVVVGRSRASAAPRRRSVLGPGAAGAEAAAAGRVDRRRQLARLSGLQPGAVDDSGSGTGIDGEQGGGVRVGGCA